MDEDVDGDGPEDERSEQVRGALLRALLGVVVIGVVIALGTVVVVRALGLNDNDSAGPVGSGPTGPAEPLPTTALPVPGEETGSATPTATPSATASPTAGGKGEIQLAISPLNPSPGERVNLTGKYQGADNVSLQVQRYEGGSWRDFGVEATVRVGSYATYVMTQRTGEQRFRMFDPQTKQGSNVILVTIG